MVEIKLLIYGFHHSKKDLKYLVKDSQTPKGLNEQGVKELSKAGFYKSLEINDKIIFIKRNIIEE